MMHYICKDRYRLELHWDKIVYHDDSSALLKGAYFSGPVLKTAQKINGADTISMDLTPQHLVVLDSYYIVKLDWSTVEYTGDGRVLLGNAIVKNDHLKTLHKLEDEDFIVIDTEKHEERTHAYHLLYDSQVVRHDKKPYTYTK
jgi:hypothetical protein